MHNASGVNSAAIASAFVWLSSERFEDPAPEVADLPCHATTVSGRPVSRIRNYDDLAYRGFNYSITIAGTVFKVRSYDDMPGRYTVLSHTLAIGSALTRQLVDCLLTEFGCWEVCFYDGETDSYREIDLQTLEFQTFRF